MLVLPRYSLSSAVQPEGEATQLQQCSGPGVVAFASDEWLLPLIGFQEFCIASSFFIPSVIVVLRVVRQSFDGRLRQVHPQIDLSSFFLLRTTALLL